MLCRTSKHNLNKQTCGSIYFRDDRHVNLNTRLPRKVHVCIFNDYNVAILEIKIFYLTQELNGFNSNGSWLSYCMLFYLNDRNVNSPLIKKFYIMFTFKLYLYTLFIVTCFILYLRLVSSYPGIPLYRPDLPAPRPAVHCVVHVRGEDTSTYSSHCHHRPLILCR